MALGPNDPGETVPDRDVAAAGEMVRAFELTVVEGPATGTTHRADQAVCTIGSHPPADLVIADPTVSRFHCELRVERGGVRVRDLDSLNGTTIDGVRVMDAFLRSGSMLRLGRTTIRFDLSPSTSLLRLSSSNQFGDLAGESIAMRQVFAILERAAPTTTTVLLEGETGTGKTAIAHALHQESPRAGGPFVMVDCGALPRTLLESELFGHERGAFTGADSRRIGAFEEAGGGTLFLDEIGELPVDLQPKLLGALENRTVRRVGGNQSIAIDARVVAATNRDLRAEVNAGRFRPDLYFRLAVVRIEVPPLRRRPDDLPLLARSLLARLGAAPEQIERLCQPELLDRLAQVAWPGNIRELKNYLERCLVFDDALPPEAGTPPDTDSDAGRIDDHLPFSDARERALARFERRYLQALLKRHKGVVSAAAAEAGIDRTYFYRMLKRHGLPR